MPRDDGGDFEVGYGKPPRHTRFKRGQSGNPKGRPSEKKNLSTVLEDALAEAVVAVVGKGRSKKITKFEAIITQLVNKSASGDPKATQQLLPLLREIEGRGDPGSTDPAAITEADRQIIQRIQAEFCGENE
jgi:hypothetical protein